MSSQTQLNAAADRTEWESSNGWRQGSVLRREDALNLQLIAREDEARFAMVISHDCDCVVMPDKEPFIELVIGTQLKKKLDSGLTYAKSTRALQLGLEGCDRKIDLRAVNRCQIKKEHLARCLPSDDWKMSDKEKRILARWLASRYDRASFPNELVNRMVPVRAIFQDAAQRHGAHTVGIFITFEPSGEIESAEEPYTLQIAAVYDVTAFGAEAEANALCAALVVGFEDKFLTPPGVWRGIELMRCEAVPDNEFTYHDAQSSYVYRLDDISLQSHETAALPQ